MNKTLVTLASIILVIVALGVIGWIIFGDVGLLAKLGVNP